MRRSLFLLTLWACAPVEPAIGFGVPDTTADGLVDTDDDGVGDLPVVALCPAVVMERPQIFRHADAAIAEAAGFESAYRFKLNHGGEVGICYRGNKESQPLWWACADGGIDIYAGGIIGQWAANADGLIASIDVLERVDDGWAVEVTAAKHGSVEQGIVYDDPKGCR